MISDTELVQGVLDGSIGSKQLGEIMSPRIKRICKLVASKIKCNDEDLAQELWIILVSKIFPKYIPGYDLNGYIYEYARHMAMHVRGSENKDVYLEDFVGKGKNDENEFTVDIVGFTEIDVASVYSKIAGERLLAKSVNDVETFRKLPEISEKLLDARFGKSDIVEELKRFGFGEGVTIEALEKTAELMDEFVRSDEDKSKKKNLDGLSDDQKELREIRLSMGKTKAEFSEALGIRVASLDSYEYGRTKGVPVDIMKNARLMHANYTDEYVLVKTLFSGLKMSGIVSYWAKLLKVELDDKDALAICLRTTSTTIGRWLKDESMPRIKKIGELHQQVLLLEKLRLQD